MARESIGRPGPAHDGLVTIPREAEPDPAEAARRGRGREGMRRRSVVMMLGLVALGAVLAADSGLLWMALGVVGLPMLGLAIVAAAAALGMVGFGLFAAAGRVAGAVRRAGRWPDEEGPVRPT